MGVEKLNFDLCISIVVHLRSEEILNDRVFLKMDTYTLLELPLEY